MMHDEMPFVPRDLVDYLDAIYTPAFFVNADVDNNDVRMGYMQGVTEVLSVLRNLAERKDD